MQIIRLYLILIVLLLMAISGCIDTHGWGTPPPYKKPPNMTVDNNVSKMINEEWNKINGSTGVTIDNSSIRFNSYVAEDYESFTFNTADGKTYICTMSIKSSETPNMRDINDHPVEAYNMTIAPYRLVSTPDGPQPVVTAAPPLRPL